MVEDKDPIKRNFQTANIKDLASFPGHSQIYLKAIDKNREKAWDHCYVMGQKWWTRLVCNVDWVCTN